MLLYHQVLESTIPLELPEYPLGPRPEAVLHCSPGLVPHLPGHNEPLIHDSKLAGHDKNAYKLIQVLECTSVLVMSSSCNAKADQLRTDMPSCLALKHQSKSSNDAMVKSVSKSRFT